MNIDDKDYNNLVAAMTAVADFAGAYENKKVDNKTISEFYKLRRDFSVIANNILKREWRKTKQHLREDTVKVSALSSERIDGSHSVYLYGAVPSQTGNDQ